MKKCVFFLSIACICLSSCASKIQIIKKIICNNIRYIETKNSYIADCFFVPCDAVADGVCNMEYNLIIKDDKPTHFGRLNKLKSKGGNDFDKYGITSLNGSLPNYICLCFNDFNSYGYVPLEINIRFFINSSVNYGATAKPYILFWIPNCKITTGNPFGMIRFTHINLEMHFWDGYIAPDYDPNIKCWNGEFWLFDYVQEFDVLFTDELSGDYIYE